MRPFSQLFLDPILQECPIKSPLSVCRLSISLAFFQEMTQ